jgi:putative ABC transport system permease protein
MGRSLLIARLVLRDLRRRRLQSVLLVGMIAVTTSTLALALTLSHTSEGQFALTRAATAGPDVVAAFQPNLGSRSTSPAPLAPLAHAPGVTGTAGPYPIAFARLTGRGTDLPIEAIGRNSDAATIDRPLLTSGRWAGPNTAVLEQGLARTLGLHVGDAISVGGRHIRVAGIALSTAQGFYPARRPGLIWVTPGAARSLASRAQPLGYMLELRLANPASAPAFSNSAAANAFARATSNGSSVLQPWQQTRSEDYKIESFDQTVLLVVSTLLAILAVASIAVIVGGRMAEQTRRVGLLKAVGATPRLIGFMLLTENVLLAVAAAAAGLGIAAVAAPTLANPGDGLLGSSVSPPLTLATIGLVGLAAVAVATVATLLPAVRGARVSTIAALTEPVHAPQRRRRLIALSARLPAPMLLGLRLMARRTRRSMLIAASLTIAVAMFVAALAIKHRIDVRDQQAPTGLYIATGPGDRITHLVLLLNAILIVLAAINAIFTGWATAIDAERTTAVARALGATPRQVSSALIVAQLLPGFAAVCLGIPAGLLLYQAAGGPLNSAGPPIPWLLAMFPGTLVSVAALTAVPARAVARRDVATVLRTE